MIAKLSFSFLSPRTRLLETDQKSLNSIQSTTASTHSRRSSDTSENSIVSVSIDQLNQICNGYTASEGSADDLFAVWGQIINDWPNFYKKQKSFIQVFSLPLSQIILLALLIRFLFRTHRTSSAKAFHKIYAASSGSCCAMCTTTERRCAKSTCSSYGCPRLARRLSSETFHEPFQSTTTSGRRAAPGRRAFSTS